MIPTTSTSTRESRTDLTGLNNKEKDNRWLQLPICKYFVDNAIGSCPDGFDNCGNAHPTPLVLNYNRLKNGNVVCCQDYIFRDSPSSKRKSANGCIRGMECRYYHPSKYQEEIVKKAGKMNQEIKAIYSSQLQQELLKQQQWMAAANNPYLMCGGVWPSNPVLPSTTPPCSEEVKIMNDLIVQHHQQMLLTQYYQQYNLSVIQQQLPTWNQQHHLPPLQPTYQQGFQPNPNL